MRSNSFRFSFFAVLKFRVNLFEYRDNNSKPLTVVRRTACNEKQPIESHEYNYISERSRVQTRHERGSNYLPDR